MSGWWENIEDVMRTHLALADDDLFYSVRTFEAATYLRGDGFSDISTDTKVLDSLETAIRKLSPMLEELSEGSLGAMNTHFFENEGLSHPEAFKLICCILTVQFKKEALIRGIEAARANLKENGPLTKRTTKTLNIEAIKAVQGAIEAWQRFASTPPPTRALNPASPFGEFLADLFEACMIEADPKSAFRAWAGTFGKEVA